MFDNIAMFEGLITPTDLIAISELEMMFVEYQYFDHQLALQEIPAAAELELTEQAEQVYSLYAQHATSVINSFGVKLVTSERLALPILFQILSGLLVMDSPDNADVIEHALLDDSDDAIHTLASILAELTELKESDIWFMLDSVDVSLILLLSDSTIAPNLHEAVLIKTTEVKMEYLKASENKRSGLVFEMIRKAERLPLAWTLVEINLVENQEQMATQRTVADQIYLGLIVSGIEQKDRLVTGLVFREEHFPNGFDRVDVLLRELIGEDENE